MVMLQNYLCAILLLFFSVCALAEKNQGVILPTLLVKPVTAMVMRGEAVEIPVKVVSAYGGEVKFEVSQSTRFGTLDILARHSASTPLLHYTNDRGVKTQEDTFRFRVKSPGHAWNTYSARILINDPRGTLDAHPKKVEFGKVPLGTIARKSLRISNRFGANVSGTLLASAPYSISGGGVFSLGEGETKNIEVCFSPTEIRHEEAEIKVAPFIDNFPLISLKGEGVPPFHVDRGSATLSDEIPRADFRITNMAAAPITLECSGDPTLQLSDPIVIPAYGTGILSLAMKQSDLPVGSSKLMHSLIGTRSYSIPLEITALGPPGKVSMESLNGSKIITCIQGQSVQLKGILKNSSSVSHEVELVLGDHQDSPIQAGKKFSIPASSETPFELSWTPVNPGLSIPSVKLLESGVVIGEASWKVSVQVPAPKVPLPGPSVLPTPITPQPPAPVSPQNRLATQDEKERLAIWLPPRFEEGLIRRRLVLQWSFYGSTNTDFVVTERILRNSLSDRTGENPLESWNRLKGSPICHNAVWELKIPVPFPGTHTYMVYPNVVGEKMVSPLTLGISWSMFAWPGLRLLLAGIFIVCLVKVIRRRNWGRR